MNDQFAWQKWEPENILPEEKDLPIEWCNAVTKERHACFNWGGLNRAVKKKPTHWRKIEPSPPLPEK